MIDKMIPAEAFAIGSRRWPGLAKVAEEAGEVIQVIGKLIATNGADHGFNGENLREKLIEEMADVYAAIGFVVQKVLTSAETSAFHERVGLKKATFFEWQREGEAKFSKNVHLLTQRNQSYGSVRKCCERCGRMHTPDDSHIWTDNEAFFNAAPDRCTGDR